MSRDIVAEINRVHGTHVWLGIKQYEALLCEAANEITALRELLRRGVELAGKPCGCSDVREWMVNARVAGGDDE